MSGASEQSKGVESLENFERALGHVRNSVRPLTLMSLEEVGSCVGAADRAKLNLQVAYGVSSLFYMFLRTQGVSPAGHPVKAELDRIRKYFGRLKQVGKPPEQRTMKVDADASRRFINAALSGDSVWQNAKATDPESARQKRAGAGIGRSGPAGAPESAENTTAHDGTAGAGAGTPAGSAPAGGANAGKKALPGSSSSSSSKRKLEAAADGDGNGGGGWVSAAKGGRAKGKRRSGGGGKVGGGGGGSAGGGSAAAEPPQWGDRPQAAVPGETPRAAKKAKGTTGGKNKKKARYRAW